MGNRDKARKNDGRVECHASEVPVVGEEVWVSLGKETDEHQYTHQTHVGRLPELVCYKDIEGGEDGRKILSYCAL